MAQQNAFQNFLSDILNQEPISTTDEEEEYDEDILPIVDYEEPFDIREIPELYNRMYKARYHLNEILKRIQCLESNKPSLEEVEQIKEKLNGDFSKENIHRNTTYNQRKHLIYIYCTLNNKPCLWLDRHEQVIKNCFCSILYADLFERKNMYNFQLILDVIAQKYDFQNIRDYLYFKPMKNRDKRIKIIWDLI